MQVRSLKNFYWKDEKKEKMVKIKKNDVFDVFPDKDAEQIYEALQSGWIEIIDKDFISETGRYLGLLNFSGVKSDGSPLRIIPGQSITLNQSEAGRLMLSGHVRPENETQWHPQSLLTGGISIAAPKRMFDDEPPEPPKKNWVFDYGVKGALDENH